MPEHMATWLRRFALPATLLAASMALAAGLTDAAMDMLPWMVLGELAALTLAVLTAGLLRLPSPVPKPAELDRHVELTAVRHLVERYGEDSIASFIARPDKSFEFAAGGVLAYRVFGRTAVVSGDPVGPEGAAPAVLASFLRTARSHNWEVVVYGASADQLDGYHQLGFRSICVGEEAIARPQHFSLAGRRVRKLRQSVHRVRRRGWQISAHDGVDIDAATEAELAALEASWRARHPRVLGFAMSMGRFEGGVCPADLYLLARSPEGTLTAAMRFIAHRGKLSLDTMRRVGEAPNGLNEALVCHALEVARERGISEVSLNYAGLAHLVRLSRARDWATRTALRLVLRCLGRHFQMERLVRFNEKFSPEWRPRYLIYRTRRSLPRAVFSVLEAEGYVSRQRRREPTRTQPLAPPRPALLGVEPNARRR